jgi:hypothetical protein
MLDAPITQHDQERAACVCGLTPNFLTRVRRHFTRGHWSGRKFLRKKFTISRTFLFSVTVKSAAVRFLDGRAFRIDRCHR